MRVIAALLTLTLAGLSSASAQSLADVAQKESERRQAVTTSGKAYSNRDLEPTAPTPADSADRAQPAATAALLAQTQAAYPAIRLAALLSLTDRGADPQVRRAMDEGLTDARRTVRMAAALGLLNDGDHAPRPASQTAAIRHLLLHKDSPWICSARCPVH